MGLSELYLGDSKTADMQVIRWAKKELKRENAKERIIKDIYNGLLEVHNSNKKKDMTKKKKIYSVK